MRKRFFYVIAIILFFLGLLSIGSYFYFSNSLLLEEEFIITDIFYEDNIVDIEIDGDTEGLYCYVSSIDDYDSFEWIETEKGKCSQKIVNEGIYYVYIKKGDKVTKLDNVNKLLDVFIYDSNYYLALKDSKKLDYGYISIGDVEIDVSSLNNNVFTIEKGIIKAVSSGNSKLVISHEDIKKEATVVVTDLINKMPKKYNYDRSYLSCNRFSFKEEELLDTILFDRIKDAGEKTRAGVVAAARFLTLEFPYRISYFSENGRLGNYSGGSKVDGEGRFYHKGLYLTSSKFDDLDFNYIDKGPSPWGCSIYSRPSKAMRSNGLDCSGFTTWVVYNGGFDIEDLAAHGGDDTIYNLNDIGDEKTLTLELALSDKIKAGDLLGEVTVSEGHSAIVVGVDDNNYYVAESLWEYPLGVNINTYSKKELSEKFETVNLMDSYYKKDGNYTPMWY